MLFKQNRAHKYDVPVYRGFRLRECFCLMIFVFTHAKYYKANHVPIIPCGKCQAFRKSPILLLVNRIEPMIPLGVHWKFFFDSSNIHSQKFNLPDCCAIGGLEEFTDQFPEEEWKSTPVLYFGLWITVSDLRGRRDFRFAAWHFRPQSELFSIIGICLKRFQKQPS